MAENLSKRFYFKHREDYEPAALKKRLVERELEVRIVKNGIILPARRVDANDKELGFKGGVCDENFNFVAGYTRMDPHQVNSKGRRAFDVASSYVVDRNKISYLDEDVIFGGALMGHFGHFMIECWSRLWYVLQPPSNIKNFITNSKILFITTAQGGYKPWFDDFFQLMGISKEQIMYVDKPIQCRSIIVPEQSVYLGTTLSTVFTKEYLIPCETIKTKVTPGKRKKIFLSRKDWGTFKNHNEKYFEDFFVAHGFESISIEKFSIEEQISIISGADEIASGTGTLTHWALFCKSKAKFIMLNRDPTYRGWQTFVNEATKIDAFVVDCSRNFLYADSSNGVILFGANECWRKFVLDYFNEQIETDDDCLYFDTALKEYISDWFTKYPNNRELWIDSVERLCQQIMMLEKEIAKRRPLLVYQTHVGKKGWIDWKFENQPSNTHDQNFDIQAIKIDFSNPFCNLYYSVYYNEQEGWSEEVANSQISGTTGKSKSIFGIKIRLDDTGREKYDICYRVHTFDGKWTSWAKNGEKIISPEKLNSLQIKLENKQKLLFEQVKPGTFTINK